jgi:hypothetical protein
VTCQALVNTDRFKRIALLVDAAAPRCAYGELARRLARDASVSILRAEPKQELPASIALLLDFERIGRRAPPPRLAAPCKDIAFTSRTLAEERPDLVIDLCGSDVSVNGPTVMRVLYDGAAGETALFAALLAGRMPVIDIVDEASGALLARGVPSGGGGATVAERLESVLARVLTLLISAVRGQGSIADAATPPMPRLSSRKLLGFELRSLANAAARQLYHLCCYAPHWRVLWRFVDGPDLWETRTIANTSWNVIPDPGFRFYADPFPFSHDGRLYVFVEELDHRENKGKISVVPFDDRGPSGPAKLVLEEPWHLSYPFLIRHAGQIWMMPESLADRSVTLYRADPFPHRWVREATLLSGIGASDATIVQHGDRFWMLASVWDGEGSWSDTLSIFSATDLFGPWEPHAANPVLVDQASARSAGNIVERHGRLWRPVQDLTNGPGTGIGLAEIIRLDQEKYEQKVRAVLRAPQDWPGRRLHTLNRAGRLECIDAAAHSPRSRLLARTLESWSGRREMPTSGTDV